MSLSPRVQVSLDLDTHEAITRYSDAVGMSRSSVISTFMAQLTPALNKLSNIAETANALDQKSKDALKAHMAASQSLFELSAQELMNEIDGALQASEAIGRGGRASGYSATSQRLSGEDFEVAQPPYINKGVRK